jgi:predicted lactoylglutathione lyase
MKYPSEQRATRQQRALAITRDFMKEDYLSITKPKLRSSFAQTMEPKIFINLPVSQLSASMDLYTALGFTNNLQFSDESGKCMVWSDHIYVMLLSQEKFKTFATKPIADTQRTLAGLYSLSLESIEHVNQTMERGLQAGGKEPHPPRDLGFMYQRTLEDADGHTWELFYMDFPT